MKTAARNAAVVVLVMGAMACGTSGWAQSSQGSATIISNAETQKVWEAIEPGVHDDKLVKGVDTHGSAGNIGLSVIHYQPTTTKWNGEASEHTKVTEVFYVLKGSATMALGGEFDGAPTASRTSPLFGPTVSGKAKGYKLQKIAAGDSVILPPNTLHNFVEIPEHLDFIVYRIDPEKSTTAK